MLIVNCFFNYDTKVQRIFETTKLFWLKDVKIMN